MLRRRDHPELAGWREHTPTIMTSFAILLAGTLAAWAVKRRNPRMSWRVALAACSLALIAAMMQSRSLPWESTLVSWQPPGSETVGLVVSAQPWGWASWVFLLTTAAAAIASAGARRKEVGMEEAIALVALAVAGWLPLVSTGHPSLWMALVAFDLISMAVGLLTTDGPDATGSVVYQAAGGILAASLLGLVIPLGNGSVTGQAGNLLLLAAYLLRVGGIPWRPEGERKRPLLAALRDGLTLVLGMRVLQEFAPAGPAGWVEWVSIGLGMVGVGLAVVRSFLDPGLPGTRSASLLAVASLPLLAWGATGQADEGIGAPAYLLLVAPFLARIQVSGREERVWIGILCVASLPWVTAPAGAAPLPLRMGGNVLLQACLWLVAIRYVRSGTTERPPMAGLQPALDRLSIVVPLAVVLAFGGAGMVILGEMPDASSVGGAALALGLTWGSAKIDNRARRRWTRSVAVLSPPPGRSLDAAAVGVVRSIFGGIAGLLEGDGALLWLAAGLLYAGLAASAMLAA